MKTYLGGCVYIDVDGYDLVLTVENDRGTIDTIYLEPDVQARLVDYIVTAHDKRINDEATVEGGK